MRYKTEFIFNARPEEIFDAIHRYKVERNPNKYFLGNFTKLFIDMDFKVLTTETLGLGATYGWNIKVFGIPTLKFTERIVEWQKGRTVAYEAVSGWKMFFRIDLESVGEATLVKVQLDYSTGSRFFDRLPRLLVVSGLKRASQNLIKRGLE
ncbi:MAG: hypothetical protein IBX64_09355, partial [Actinobacteria bacterium]|nr:hypothetical protein [Actinomycetota bacterium]